MYNWLISLFQLMGIENINLIFSNQNITIYTAECLSGIITITILVSAIFFTVKLLLIPSKFFHGLYHKWAKKRGIKDE